jgi:hypothetical protein
MSKALSYATSTGLPILGALIIAGCGQSSAKAPLTPIGETKSPSKAPAPVSDGAVAPVRQPPAGMGNAIGRILYDGKGAPGIEVQLCEEIRFIGGPSGQRYTAKTDKQGFYVIDKVKPGEYSLAVRVFNSDKFLYPTRGVLSAAKYKVEPDNSLDIPAVNLWKVDLKTQSPTNGGTVKTDKPALAWKAYPGAASYKVSVTPKQGGASLSSMETSELTATPDASLLNGDYQWRVEAFNAEGVKIAETPDPSSFKVVGQAGSNTVDLVAPKQDASIAGTGVKLQWKAHPQADDYRVYLKGAGAANAVLSFVTVNGDSHDVPGPLPADQYFWSVEVYKGGTKIAASELQRFTVK